MQGACCRHIREGDIGDALYKEDKKIKRLRSLSTEVTIQYVCLEYQVILYMCASISCVETD